MSQNIEQSERDAFYRESLEKIEREFNPENCTITFEDDAEEEYKYVLTDLGELERDFLKGHNLVAKWTFVAQNDTVQVTPVIPKDVVASSNPQDLQNYIKSKIIETATATLLKQKYPTETLND